MVQMKGCKGSQIMYLSVAFVLFFFSFFFLRKTVPFFLFLFCTMKLKLVVGAYY